MFPLGSWLQPAGLIFPVGDIELTGEDWMLNKMHK